MSVAESAERLRQLLADYKPNRSTPVFLSEVKDDIDQLLGLHLPDDGQPVDEEWLLSVGFEEHRMSRRVVIGGDLFWNDGPHGPYWCIGTKVCKGPAATRGDARLICRALGIELKETANA